MNPTNETSGVNTLLLVLLLIGLTVAAVWFFTGRTDLAPANDGNIDISVDAPSLPTTPSGTDTGE